MAAQCTEAITLTVSGDIPSPMVSLAIDGPRSIERRLVSPLARFKDVCEDPGVTPGLLAVAERITGMEVEACHNSRIGDALLAQEAKEAMSEVIQVHAL